LIGIAGALLYLVFIVRGCLHNEAGTVGTLFDDALISMRYANNLTHGHGLTWNPGERPWVEGYTNLGWTLVMSLVLFVFPKNIAPIVVSIIAGGLVLGSAFVGARLLRPFGRTTSIIAAGLIATYFPFVFWSLRGMEVAMLTLLLLCALNIALTP